MPKRFFLCAGEKSGDLLGAALIKSIQKVCPDSEYFGVAGPAMQSAGCHVFAEMESLSVMGLTETIKKIPFFLSLKRSLIEFIREESIDLFIGIDFTEFNLSVEKSLKAFSIKTCHYKSPSVWAWRRNRLNLIRQAVDKMLLLFPFEKKIYEDAGIAADYIGHPLADQIPLESSVKAARDRLGLAEQDHVVALLPGSRMHEIRRLLPIFLEAAKGLDKALDSVRFVLPVASKAQRILIESQLALHPELSIMLLDGQAQTAIQGSDLVILSSGTATLEAMLLKKPMVVCYRLSALTYALLKPLMYIDHYALPNILADRVIVPELIQNDLTPDSLCHAALTELSRSKSEWLPTFQQLHQTLKCDASDRAAKAVLELVR